MITCKETHKSSEKERGKDVSLRIICTAVAADTMKVDKMALRVGIQRKEEGSEDRTWDLAALWDKEAKTKGKTSILSCYGLKLYRARPAHQSKTQFFPLPVPPIKRLMQAS